MPHLPAEIADEIVQCFGTEHSGLVFLWTSGRHISRTWKDGVEQYFASVVLPRTTIWLSNEKFVYGNPPHEHDRQSDRECRIDGADEIYNYYIRTNQDVLFDFSTATENDAIAIFEPRSTNKSKPINRSLKALQEVQGRSEMLLKPNHVVQVGKYVNDVYLPDLRIDRSLRSFRLNWKAMFSLFFFEEQTFLSACRKWVHNPLWPELMRGFGWADSNLWSMDVDWKRGYRKQMEHALTTAKQAKRDARRRRTGYLYRTLFKGKLAKDKRFRIAESVVLRRIDDVRFLAARDERFLNDKEDCDSTNAPVYSYTHYAIEQNQWDHHLEGY